MRKLLCIALLALLPGCALFAPASIPVSQTLPAAAQEVQKNINEVNIALAAAANVVAQDLKDGILTKVEAQAYVDAIKDLAKKSDQTQELLAGGKILDAKNQAELMSAAILALHREVASRRKK